MLRSDDEARAVLIALDPGQELGDHQVKEHAWVVVVEGQRRVHGDGQTIDAPTGTLVHFEPDERHSVRSAGAAPGCCSSSRRGPARATTAATETSGG